MKINKCLNVCNYVVPMCLDRINQCACVRPCLALCVPMDCSSPGSSVHGISQARTLEWVVISAKGDLLDPEVKPTSLALVGKFFTTASWEALGVTNKNLLNLISDY